MSEPLTTREILESLDTNRARIQHWGRLMGIKPIERGSRGVDAVYTRGDLLCFLLCQRLAEGMGMSVTQAARVVAGLRKEPGYNHLAHMGRLSIQITPWKPRKGAGFGILPMLSRGHNERRRRGYMTLAEHKEDRSQESQMAAEVIVNLRDLQEKAGLS